MFNVLMYSNHPFYEVIVLRTITCPRNSSQSINLPSSKLVDVGRRNKSIFQCLNFSQLCSLSGMYVIHLWWYPTKMDAHLNSLFGKLHTSNLLGCFLLDSRTNGQDHQVIIRIYLYFQLLTPTISVNDDCFLCVKKPAVIVGIDKLPGLPPAGSAPPRWLHEPWGAASV